MLSHIKRATSSADRPPAEPAGSDAKGPWEHGALALPRVAVIISSYNYAHYIEAALGSVAAQSYANLECVVVDDASKDDSVAVIDNWLARADDRRFRLIASPANRGQLSSIAAGLAATDGEFVAILDADDLWLPEFLHRHVQVHLNTQAASAASCSHLMQIDREGRVLAGNAQWQDLGSGGKQSRLPIAASAMPRLDQDAAAWPAAEPGGARLLYPDLFGWYWSATSAMVFRRSMLELVMPADPGQVRICADHYLMSLCHYFSGSLLVEEVLGAYRRHGNNSFATLPVLGSQAALAPGHGKSLMVQNFAVMLAHVTDRYDTFASIYGSHVPRKFLGEVRRYLQAEGFATGAQVDARLRAAKRAVVAEFFRTLRRRFS